MWIGKRRLLFFAITFALSAGGLLTMVQLFRVTGRVPIHPNPSPPLAGVSAAPVEYEWTDSELTFAHAYIKPVLDEYLDDLPRNAKVVDLGSGNGALLATYRDRGWHLTGIDVSESGIAQARKNFANIDFRVADVTVPIDAGLVPESFDAVISTEVIEHVFNPRGLVRNGMRLLKPGGRMILSTPYHGYMKNVVTAVSGRFDEQVNPLLDYGHIKFFSLKTLTSLFWEIGFRELEFSGAGRLPYLWKSMIMKGVKPSATHLPQG